MRLFRYLPVLNAAVAAIVPAGARRAPAGTMAARLGDHLMPRDAEQVNAAKSGATR